MDRYQKISVFYILLPVVVYGGFGILSWSFPYKVRGLLGLLNSFNALFLVYHLIYLKLTLDDTRKKGKSKLWVILIAITGILGSLFYMFKRR